MGLVKELAMMVPGCGSRLLVPLFPRLPRRTPSICRSTHQMPGMPSRIHSAPFLTRALSGSQERKAK